ncbi:MAG: hypothetical protein JW735_09105 [Prolixibacteraceae bacterium]|nr:hypothetical protein [Prolixibacteraceae bacterium]
MIKRTKAVCVLIVLLVFSFSIRAQNNETIMKNSVQMHLGWEQGYFKDANFSPLNYVSGGLAIQMGYQRNTKNDDLIFISTDFVPGALINMHSEYATSARYIANIEMGYLKEIGNNIPTITTKLGGQYHTYLDMAFFNGVQAVTFFGLHSIDLAGKVEWDLAPKHSLSGTLALPVFGLLVRPPWTGWDKFIVSNEESLIPIFFRGKWTSINNFLACNLDVQYQYKIAPQWDFVAGYQFRYYRTQTLKTAIIPSSQITIGTNFKF